jgi:hypothetical protein
MNYDSPRCVSAVVRFDESVSKIEWDDSFSSCDDSFSSCSTSWTTETIDLKSPVVREEDESVSRIKWNDRFSEPSCSSSATEAIDLKLPTLAFEEKSKEQEVRFRLKQVLQDRSRRLKNEPSQEDVQKEDTKLGQRQAKSVYKEMLQKQYDIVKRGRSISKPTVKDYLVDESSKILQYLKDQNAIQREEMKLLKRGEMKELKVHNQNLQEAIQMAAESQERMECHIEGLQASNSKLTDNIEVFKGCTATMKQEYQQRHAYYQCEVNTSCTYKQVIGKIVARVQERRADQLVQEMIVERRADQLVQDIFVDVLQGHMEATEALSQGSRSLWLSSSSNSSSAESDDDSDYEE